MIIKEIVLYTDLSEELKKFYTITLGLKLTDVNENSFTIQTETSGLTFKKTSEIKNPIYHFAFNIPENQFKQAKDWVLKRADLIRSGKITSDYIRWNAHSIYFYDPAGNILELIARHNLNNKSSEQFSGKSFLNISEIGFPVYDVENFYNEVNRNFNIPVFSGDKKNFCAAGDDNGLFIIVSEGSKWFPDSGYKKTFPSIVKIIPYEQKEIEFKNLPYKIISFLE